MLTPQLAPFAIRPAQIFLLAAFLASMPSIAGAASVDAATGAYQDSVPISVPPFHSIAPALSLDYTSQGSVGQLGVGWGLSALSYIERRGEHRGTPRFAASDVWWLDGNELVPCSALADATLATSCWAGGNFTTKTESYARIAGDASGFTVKQKDGTSREFRSAFDFGAGVARYYLTSTTDSNGNRINYTYWQDSWAGGPQDYTYWQSPDNWDLTDRGNDVYLDTINYNQAVVQFIWEQRPDPFSVAAGGASDATSALVKTTHRLRFINVIVAGATRNGYALDYKLSLATGRSLVAAVTPYGTGASFSCVAATRCTATGTTLPPMAFAYNEGESHTHGETWMTSTGVWGDAGYAWSGDFNGDGKTDLATAVGANVWVKLSTGTGFAADAVWTSTGGTYWGRAEDTFVGDFDGDGKDDIASAGGDGGSMVKVLLSTGAGFKSAGTWQTYGLQAFQGTVSSGSNIYHNTADHSWAGDFNGDGRSDIAASRNGLIYVLLSAGDATMGYTFSESVWGTGSKITGNIYWYTNNRGGSPPQLTDTSWMGDFNGDGRADIAVFEGDYIRGGALWVYRSTGTTFVKELWEDGIVLGSTLANQLSANTGDFNGDGKTDLTFTRAPASGVSPYTKVLLSTGTSFSPPAIWGHPRIGGRAPLLGQTWAIDVDGDGRSDLVQRARYNFCPESSDVNVSHTCKPGEPFPEAGLTVYRSTGTGFVPFGYPGENVWPIIGKVDLGFDPGARWVGDFDGDGRTDLAAGFRLDRNLDKDLDFNTGKFKPPEQIFVAHSTMGSWTVHLTTPVDTIAALTNGLGATTRFDMVPSTDWTNVNNRSVVPTVRGMTTDDGRGNSNTNRYVYTGAYSDLTEGRFVGFSRVTAFPPLLPGESPGPSVETYFELTRPDHVPRPIAVFERDGRGQVTHETQNVFAYSSTVPYRTQETQVQSVAYDNSGSASWRSVVTKISDIYNPTTQAWGPGYGNLTTEIHWGDQSGAQAKTMVYQYAPVDRSLGSPYIAGKLAVATVYAGTSASGTPLRQSVYIYDDAASWDVAPVRGNLTSEASWLDKIWANGAIVSANAYVIKRVDYDAYGNPTRTIAPATPAAPTGAVATQEYDSVFHMFPVQSTGPSGVVTTTTWDTVLGVKLEETVGAGASARTTKTTYDRFGRTIQTISPTGAIAAFQQVNEGSPTDGYVQATVGPPGGIQLWSRTYSDGLGRAYRTMSSRAMAGAEACTTVEYNARGLKAREAQAHLCSAGPTAADWTTYDYDGRNRTTQITTADGATTTTRYDLGSSTVTDAAGHSISRHVSSLGQLLSQTEWQAGAPSTTTYAYDALGRKIRTTDPKGNEWSAVLDSFNRLLIETRPDQGTFTSSFDSMGKPLTVTNALGEQTSFEYDVVGRLLKRTNIDGTSTFAYGEERVGYANDNQLTSHTDAAGNSATIDYDKGGNVVHTTSTLFGVTYSDSSTYDAYGRLQYHVYPDGEWLRGGSHGWNPVPIDDLNLVPDPSLVPTLDNPDPDKLLPPTPRPPKKIGLPVAPLPTGDTRGFAVTVPDPIQYDAAGRVQRITVATSRRGKDEPVLDSVAYDIGGRPTMLTLGNGTTTAYAYDPVRGWMIGMHVALGGTQQQLLTYRHTLEGQVAGQTGYASGSAPVYDWSYGYDELHRLTAAADSVTPANDQLFAYDALGNMTSNSRIGAYVYGDSRHPHAVTEAGTQRFAYDTLGRMTNRNGGALTWDADGRLASSAAMTFNYDALGSRIRANGTTSTVYLGDDYEITAGVSSKIIRLMGAPIAKRRAAVTTFLHTDRLGSVALETDTAGAVVARPTYRPYGEPISDARIGAPGYTGQRQDESGLLYLHARYFDPALGRFISPDPTLPSNRLVGYNAYAYGANNPLSNTDIDGLGWFDWVMSAARIVVAVYAPYLTPVLSAISVARSIIENGFEAGIASGIQSTVMGAFQSGPETAGGGMIADAAVHFASGFTMAVFSGQSMRSALASAAMGSAESLGTSLLGEIKASTGEKSPSGQQAEMNGVESSESGSSAGSTSARETCFVAGTPITLSDGSTRDIEDVEVGDHVLAYDTSTGRTTAARVNRTFVHLNETDGTLLIDGKLRVTPNHPFYANGEWVRADRLKPGDMLVQLEADPGSGSERFTTHARALGAVAAQAGGQLVYNIEVDAKHDYFAANVLVHNKSLGAAGCCDEAREVLRNMVRLGYWVYNKMHPAGRQALDIADNLTGASDVVTDLGKGQYVKAGVGAALIVLPEGKGAAAAARALKINREAVIGLAKMYQSKRSISYKDAMTLLDMARSVGIEARNDILKGSHWLVSSAGKGKIATPHINIGKSHIPVDLPCQRFHHMGF